MSGGVRYQLVSWKPPPDAGGLKQGLRDANARVLVYKPMGYRLLCSDKVAKGLLKQVRGGVLPWGGTENEWVEHGKMNWSG